MLFLYIHTHPLEKCLLDKPQEMNRILSKMQEESKKSGIKMMGIYVAAHEHTSYFILEAEDIAALEKFLAPMTLIGNGRLIPVMNIEQVHAIGR